ncbi:succinyldiaminopimelate aminotransferase [Nannocystis exedens]|nr:succinyldiaminopimelate aminotransferase [Nannocystis exedens]
MELERTEIHARELWRVRAAAASAILAPVELHDLLERLRRDYAALNPQVERIDALLAEAGEHVVHDHLALRTWGDSRCDIDVLARPFVRAGYRAAGAYRFAEKRLVARHFAHDDPHLPLVFVSELVLDRFSPGFQDMVRSLLAQVPEDMFAAPDLCARGRPWQVAHADVEALRRESEYAAWLAAFGWRANHFTVACHALARLSDLAALDEFLVAHGLRLNTAGGEIKGSPAQGLEQSSTVADVVDVAFTDGTFAVPACYYEFARRWPGPDGRQFRGFIEGSADKIFESTDRRPAS